MSPSCLTALTTWDDRRRSQPCGWGRRQGAGGLILAVFAAWKLGAGPVLSFWLAYILTRPLGANIGDFLSADKVDGGLGLGTLITSLLFLVTIAAVVTFLTVTRRDVTERAAVH